ncbi:MAG TPA: hypothetical protein VHR66_01685 [Gemmataceae bacterium]|jgi:hypothetical protein|nr:hypothetical protein [Gemmataceae bacterium]
MRFAVVALLTCVGLAPAANLEDANKLIVQLKAVAKEGAGNQEAGAAWKGLVAIGGDAILPTLNAMDDASPSAANWLRSAVNAVTEKEVAAGKKLPAEALEAFLNDLKHDPSARRLAYEVLVMADPKAPERLLPSYLNDASGEMRRDAIAAALKKAEKLAGEAAKKEYARLFAVVRDDDQAKTIGTALHKLGGNPDVVSQFGIVTKWQIAGPFDSPKGAGFAGKALPESKVDLKAKYEGKEKAEVMWKPHVVEVDPTKFELDQIGNVDFNKVLAKHKDAVAYGYTIVESEKELPVEIRVGCINAVKFFLNGKELFAREEYHHGSRFDQYVAKATLKAGKNELLVKVCQNDQKEPWAQLWQFQARICDATGGAVPVKNVTPVN